MRRALLALLLLPSLALAATGRPPPWLDTAMPGWLDTSAGRRIPEAPGWRTFRSNTQVAYEVYNRSQPVTFTAPGVVPTMPPAMALARTALSRAQVSRLTVTETLSWQMGPRWAMEVVIPYAFASFDGSLGDLQRPPVLGFAGGNTVQGFVGSIVDANGNRVVDTGLTAAGVSLTASPGAPTAASFDLSGVKDISVRPRWQVSEPLAVELDLRIPTGKNQLGPDEQALVAALGEASIEVDEPAFGRGFDAGFLADWKLAKDWRLLAGYARTGEYEQTFSPRLSAYFDQGTGALNEIVRSNAPAGGEELFPAAPAATTRTVTRRDPADQITVGAEWSPTAQEEIRLLSRGYVGEEVINPAGIAFGPQGDAAPARVELDRAADYRLSYRRQSRLDADRTGLLAVYYERKGLSDVATPAGFVVRDVEFGDRWGGDLGFEQKLSKPGDVWSYGVKSNNVSDAPAPGGGKPLPAPLGVVRASRNELSAYSGLDRQLGDGRLAAELRAGLSSDAPDLVVQAAVKREF